MRERPEAPLPRRATLLSGAAFTVGASAIHLTGIPARLAEAAPLGAGTAVLGAAQLALGLALTILPTRRLLIAGVLINVGATVLWAVGHGIGLPAGPGLWRPEPLAVTDLTLPLLEAAAALMLGLALRPTSLPRRPSAWLTAFGLVPAVLLTAFL